MSLSCDAFASSVRQLGLVEDDEAVALLQQLPAEKRDDAQAFAKLLIERSKLTKYQAAAIYQGKAEALTYGDYLVIDRIGAGGMGQVFKATHRRMDRLVALKVMSQASMKNADSVKRFEREVRTAAKLKHPNIVHAYDAGSQDGVQYLVMELVNGPDLSSLLKSQGKLPIKKAADFIAQAARGLAFAHGQGVVHRDIKPGNLLVDAAGTVKILDLGLARLDGLGEDQSKREAELTKTGALMGTVDYMAPEQALHTRHADAKSDVYSLGCTLFRLLTGGPAYTGESTIEKILAHREQPVPSLRQRRPEVPPTLDAFCQRMLAKKPDQRPSMQEVAETLGTLEVDSPAGSSGINLSAAMPPSAALGPGSSLSGLQLMPPPVAPGPGLSATGMTGETAYGFAPPMAAAVPPPMPPAIPMPSAAGRIPQRSPSSATPKNDAPPPKKPSYLPMAAGAAGALVLIALGVWFIFRDKDGNETARVQMPEGGTVHVTATADPPRVATPTPSVTPRSIGTAANPFVVPSATAAASTPPAPFDPPLTPNPPPSPSPTAVVAVTPPSAPAGADLWIYPVTFDPTTPLITVDKFRYTGSTPLTIEAWCMPFYPPALEAATRQSSDKEITLKIGGFNHTGRFAFMPGITWKTTPGDPTKDGWGSEHLRRRDGEPFPMTGIGGRSPRNVPVHVAMTFYPKDAEGKQTSQFFVDGRRTQSMNYEFIYDFGGSFFSHGFFSELRISSVVRYGSEFTPPPRRFEPDAETLALYHADEGSGTQLVDSSGNNRHGTLTNAYWAPFGDVTPAAVATSVPVAPPNVALSPPTSSGQDLFIYSWPITTTEPCVNFPSVRYDGTTPLTVEAWSMPFRPDQLREYTASYGPTNYGQATLFAFGSSRAGNPEFGLTWRFHGPQFSDRLSFSRSWNTGTSTPSLASPIADMKADVPQHVAMTFKPVGGGSPLQTVEVWLDGKRILSEEKNFRIDPLKSLYTHGFLDELRISKIVRYTSDFTPQRRLEPDADTLGLFHCDEGAGTQLVDASGQGLRGDLRSGKWAGVATSATTSRLQPPAALTESDLWVYPEPFDRDVALFTVETLKYDGSTPLTVEMWAMPYYTPSLEAWSQRTRGSRISVKTFGFDHRPFHISMPGLGWETTPADPGNDDWNTSHIRLENGVTRSWAAEASDAVRNVPVHLAVVIGTKQPDGQQEMSFFVDGKRKENIRRQFVYDATAKFLSHGFFSEARISNSYRYSSNFTPQRRFEPDSQTMALYHCDEGTGTQLIDSSGNNLHGRLLNAKWSAVGAPSSVSPPIASPPIAATSPAAARPGDMWILPDRFAPDRAGIRFNSLHYDGRTPLTIEAWCVPAAIASVKDALRVMPQGYVDVHLFGLGNFPTVPSQFGWSWRMPAKTTDKDMWKLWVRRISGSQPVYNGNVYVIDPKAQTVVRDGLQHIALVLGPKGSDGKQLYDAWVDGKSIYTNENPSGLPCDPLESFYSQGFISQLRFSKVRRYTAAFTPPANFESDADTMALYLCDEGSGNRLVDSSGNNRHAVLSGMQWAPVGGLGAAGPPTVTITSPAAPTAPLVSTAPPVAPTTPIVSVIPAVRKPIPDSKALQTAVELVKEVFRDDYAAIAKQPAQKAQLAYKLLQQADTSTADAAQYYALLIEAKRLCLEVGDATIIAPALDQLVRNFEVDPTAIYCEAWDELIRKAKTDAVVQGLHDEAVIRFQPAVEAGRLDEAKQYLEVSLSATRRLRNVKLSKTATDRIAAVTDRIKDVDAVKVALRKYKDAPDDPAANFAIGRFLGVVENDWQRANAFLAKGSDETFKTAAEKAVPLPTDGAGFSTTADAWWDAAQSAKTQKSDLLLAAGYWYLLAEPKLSGLQKARAAKRIEEAGAANPAREIPVTRLSAVTAGTDLDGVLTPSANGAALPPPPVSSTAAGTSTVSSSLLSYLGTEVRADRSRVVAIGRNSSTQTYRDVPNVGGLLVGFDIANMPFSDTTCIAALRPLYQTSVGLTLGTAIGELGASPTRITAKPGYAVGKLQGSSGGYLDSLTITFMRIGDKSLNVNDSYEVRHGGTGGSSNGPFGGDGSFVVGIHGNFAPFGSNSKPGVTSVVTVPAR